MDLWILNQVFALVLLPLTLLQASSGSGGGPERTCVNGVAGNADLQYVT